MSLTENVPARSNVPFYNGNRVKQQLVKQTKVVKLLMSIAAMPHERGVSGIQPIYHHPKARLDNTLRLQSTV